MAKEKGTIKTYKADGGFGFIRRENNPAIYFHVRNCVGLGDENWLVPGSSVTFDVRNTARGPTAFNVELIW